MKAVSCKFNIDTASVEACLADGTTLSIYIPAVEDSMCLPLLAHVEADWLVYNSPVTYINLVLSGELEKYCRDNAGAHCMKD